MGSGFSWGGDSQYGQANSSGLNNLVFLRYEVQYKKNSWSTWKYFDIGTDSEDISYAGDILLDTSAGYNTSSDISSANLGSVSEKNITWTNSDYYNIYEFKARVVGIGSDSGGEIFSEWSDPE